MRLLGRRPSARILPGKTEDFGCARCGYQIATQPPHPVCPMCGHGVWTTIALTRQR
jgi:rubrerythrin